MRAGPTGTSRTMRPRRRRGPRRRGTPATRWHRAGPLRPQTVAPSHHEDAAVTTDVRSACGDRFECGDQFPLEALLVDTQLVQRAVVVFGFVHREEEVFGADVV